MTSEQELNIEAENEFDSQFNHWSPDGQTTYCGIPIVLCTDYDAPQNRQFQFCPICKALHKERTGEILTP